MGPSEFSRIAGISLSLTLLIATTGQCDDLDSRVKYKQQRARWAMQDAKQKLEAHRAQMQSQMQHHPAPTTTSSTNTGAGGGLQWYSNQGRRFRVLMIGTPTIGSSPSPFGTSSQTFSHIEKDGGIAVAVTDVPVSVKDKAAINKALNGACDGAIRNVSAQEMSRYSVQLQGHPGREVNGILPNKGKLKQRIYLVGSTLYQVILVGTPEWVDSSTSQQILNSLALI